MARFLSSSDIVLGAELICLFDDETQEDTTWHGKLCIISHIEAEGFSFEVTVHDANGNWFDEGAMNITAARGEYPYMSMHTLGSEPRVDKHICIVPISGLTEEDKFLVSLSGCYTHLLDKLGVDYDKVSNRRRL